MTAIKLHDRPTGTATPETGPTGMDRRIVTHRFAIMRWPPAVRWSVIVALLVSIVAVFYFKNTLFVGQSYSIARERLHIAKATHGTFEDFIPLTAYVAPLKTVFLDAVQGGRVEEILTEDGALVEENQAIVRLSNSDLQLNVMNTESRLMEQLNYMRDQELRFEQNRLRHKREIIDLDFDILTLTRNIGRKDTLFSQGHLSKSESEDLQDRLDYLLKKRAISFESQQSDERLIGTQLNFFKQKTLHLDENLLMARKSLEELVIRSPVKGRLSGFDMEIGQSVSRGLRVGQVSAPKTFKLVANVDEYYLDRIHLEQHGTFERNGIKYIADIAKIYPNVKDGRFQIELTIAGDAPQDLKPGQSLQAKLVLGDSTEALLIPNGPFFRDTGGNWVFVVNSTGTLAGKRTVKLGRRNNRFIEVISGINPGEEIVISGYSDFKQVSQLVIKE